MAREISTSQIKDPLFREEAQDVAPLNQDRIEPFRKRLRPRPLLHHRSHVEDLEDELIDPISESDIEAEDALYFARPGVQHRLMRDLARGRIEIGETLDLHGMTVNYAREELSRFLTYCHQRRVRCVRVVHGKGYSSQSRQPALKQKLNLWLRQRRDVLGFCSAHRRDGGTGAVYLLLSKKRGKGSRKKKINSHFER